METHGTLELNESNFTDTVAHGVTLVDFWAPWCGPCRMQGPILEDLAEEMGGQVRVAKVNVDESGALASRFRVEAIPLLVVLKDGREMQRFVGVQSKETLVQALRTAAA